MKKSFSTKKLVGEETYDAAVLCALVTFLTVVSLKAKTKFELMRKLPLLYHSEPTVNSTPLFKSAPALILLDKAPTVGSRSVVAN